MAKKKLAFLGGIALTLVIVVGLFIALPALSEYGDVSNFQDSREIVEATASTDELSRAHESYKVLQWRMLKK